MWRARLVAGDPDGAWGLFVARYRRLIHATIRRAVADEDDVEDVFAEVCVHLSADSLSCLAVHSETGTARFSTWLVTVVHHKTVDWIRHRDGRRRVAAPTGLTAIQQQIFDLIVCEHRSHVEAYELLVQHSGPTLSFGAFMHEVASTFEALERVSGKTVAHFFPGAPAPMSGAGLQPDDALVRSDTAIALAAALATLPADERLAIQLFIIDELPAAAVARTVGWPNAKAVYNRVHRALSNLRREVGRRGLGPESD